MQTPLTPSVHLLYPSYRRERWVERERQTERLRETRREVEMDRVRDTESEVEKPSKRDMEREEGSRGSRFEWEEKVGGWTLSHSQEL